MDKFVKEYLQRDGVFIMRMVARNSSDLVAAELVTGLWDQYKRKKFVFFFSCHLLHDNLLDPKF